MDSARVAFRLCTLLLATLLGLQCGWLTLTELSRAHINRLPTDASSAAAASKLRNVAQNAALMGAIRGDLWSQLAFTFAGLLWDEASQVEATELQQAHNVIDRALRKSPENPGAWLLLAGLELQHPTFGRDPIGALKMSYYTGPSEMDLTPLRLEYTARANAFDDIEMRGFLERDLRLLLSTGDSYAVVAAYNAAAPAGKLLIEQFVNDIDSSSLQILRNDPHHN